MTSSMLVRLREIERRLEKAMKAHDGPAIQAAVRERQWLMKLVYGELAGIGQIGTASAGV